MDKLVLDLIRSKNKRDVLFYISEKKQILQSQLVKITFLYASHLSRTLKYLRDEKLIVCENPNDRNYKVYKITNLGLKISKDVKKLMNDKV